MYRSCALDRLTERDLTVPPRARQLRMSDGRNPATDCIYLPLCHFPRCLLIGRIILAKRERAGEDINLAQMRNVIVLVVGVIYVRIHQAIHPFPPCDFMSRIQCMSSACLHEHTIIRAACAAQSQREHCSGRMRTRRDPHGLRRSVDSLGCLCPVSISYFYTSRPRGPVSANLFFFFFFFFSFRCRCPSFPLNSVCTEAFCARAQLE